MLDAVGMTTYGYTAFGAVQSEDGPWDSDTVTYTYANRWRSALSLSQPSAGAWPQTYAYDVLKRLTNVSSPAGAFGYAYRVSQYDGTVFGNEIEEGLPFPYDLPGTRLQRLSLPGGAYVTNTHDLFARLTDTSLKTSGATVLHQHAYALDDANRRTQQTRTAGDYVDYTYDDSGQLTSALGKESGGTTNRWHERFFYRYDAAGNLSHRVQNVQTNVFHVDSLNQLTSVVRTNNSATVAGATTIAATGVTVADNGNSPVAATRYADRTFARTNVTLLNGNNTFVAVATDSLGRVDTNTVTVNLPTAVTFLYDQNGNLRTNGSVVMAYDDENQLVAMTNAGAWASTFVYDGKLRLRLSRDYEWRNGAWVQTNEVRRVYDGMLVLQERDQFNIPKLTYTRGLDLSGSVEGAGGIGGLLALSEMSNLPSPIHSYYHCDGNGNVTALVDANQSVAARYLYDPFGNTLAATGPRAALNKYRFSSKEWHAPSSLVYYGYRWYVPELQRWVNRDPIEERGGKNLYAFVGNDPIGLYDLDGRAPPLVIGGGLVVVTVGRVVVVLTIACFSYPPCAKAAIDNAIEAAKKLRDLCRRTRRDCDKEWDDARRRCAEELAKPNPSRPFTGGYDNIEDCAKGLVSEECGGNPLPPLKPRPRREWRF
jgi:RHS repeat-associated protein